MGWLAKILGAVPGKERQGLSLGERAFWEVTPTTDLPAFLEALVDLVPAGAVLYLEGGKPPGEIDAFLKERGVGETVHLAMGTIWPRPCVSHLPITEENLRGLADLIRRQHPGATAEHLHVYKGSEVLLEWYDAICGDPLHLSQSIGEGRLKAFCGKLGLTYKMTNTAVKSTH